MKKKLSRVTLPLLLLLSLCLGTLSACNQPAPPADTPTWLGGYAEREITPEDPRTHTYYVAGYKNNNPATGVLDCQKAKAVYLEANGQGVLFVAVDAVGLSSKQIQTIERQADLPKAITLHVVSTHTHAGIDTFGLWGPVAVDGKDRAFSEQLTMQAAAAARAAYAARTEGELFFGSTTQGIEDLQHDSRAPYVYDRNLYQLRFSSPDGTSFRILDYAAHAESLRSDNTLISADFPRYMSDAIKRETGDESIFLPGAVGGLIMTKRLTDDAGHELPVTENVVETGERLARAALSITNERPLSPTLQTSRQAVELPLCNKLFVAMTALGILTNEVSSGGEGPYGLSVNTQVSLTRLDDLYIVSIPGELFPELAYGEGSTLGVTQTLRELIGEFIVVGLCDDEIGYIVPPSDFLLDEDDPYLTEAKEPNGKKHYEETNSVGPDVAERLLAAIAELYRSMQDT